MDPQLTLMEKPMHRRFLPFHVFLFRKLFVTFYPNWFRQYLLVPHLSVFYERLARLFLL